jgi:hypothetical protein
VGRLFIDIIRLSSSLHSDNRSPIESVTRLVAMSRTGKEQRDLVAAHEVPTSSTTSWQRFRWKQFLWFILQGLALITLMLGYMAEPVTRVVNNTEIEKNSRNKGDSLSTITLKEQIRRSSRPILQVSPSWQSVFSDVTTSISTVLPLFGPDGPAWRLDSDDGVYQNVTTQIPGDILSDLMREGLIDEPYMDRNFLTQNHVWMGDQKVVKRKNPVGNNSTFSTRKHLHSSTLKDDDSLQQRTRTWTYSTHFEMDSAPNDNGNQHTTSEALKWLLVVEGVKMGATIYFNGIVLGTITDQFLRFTWVLNEQNHFSKGIPTTDALHRRHELSISFDPTIGVNGRFMACSGGWDWAPYTQTGDSQGRGVFSFGIVKPIYLVPLRHFAITHVVPKIYYQGSYPRLPMLDGPNADFTVLVDVHLLYPEHPLDDAATNPENSSSSFSMTPNANVWVWSEFSGAQRRTVTTSHPADPTLGGTVILTFNLTAPKEDVKLWWPNGLGIQPMYDILVGTGDPYHSDPAVAPSGIRKRIGRYGLASNNVCVFIQHKAH